MPDLRQRLTTGSSGLSVWPRVAGPGTWRGLPLAIGFVVVVWLVDTAAGTRAVLIGFLALAPLLAAAVESSRRTAIVSLVASVVALAAGLPSDMFGSLDHLLRVAVVVSVSVVAVYVARARTARELRLQRVTEIARVTQRAVLREVPERVGQVAIHARYLSAYEAAEVGGDLYEVLDSPFGIRLIVGDVCGKGLEAVQLAASVMGAFRQAAFVRAELTQVAVDLDLLVGRESAGPGTVTFVTAVLVELHADGMQVVNCGHPSPLLRSADGAVRAVWSGMPAPPLGLGTTAPPPSVQHPWHPRDRLLLYTDGLVEARDQDGRFFPISEVLPGALATDSAPEALDLLVSRLLRHVRGEPHDDVALLLAEQLATPAPAGADATPERPGGGRVR